MFVHQGHQARLLVEYISLARQSCNVSHDFSPLFFSPGAGGMSCVDVRKRSEMGLALDLWSCLDMVRLEKGGKGERASCFWKCPVGQVLELATWQAHVFGVLFCPVGKCHRALSCPSSHRGKRRELGGNSSHLQQRSGWEAISVWMTCTSLGNGNPSPSPPGPARRCHLSCPGKRQWRLGGGGD